MNKLNMSKHFTIVINACEQQDWIKKCIESCVTQDYDNYEVIMVDALSTDETYEIAKEFETNYENFKVFQNEVRVPQIANILFLTKESKDKSIIVTVDGDDYLKNDQVLNKLNDIYTDDVWMTYGNFENLQGHKAGWVYKYPDIIIENNLFREYHWLGTHLRTYRKELFMKIDVEDFKRNGEWMSTTGDQAFMIPMLEMAGEKSRFIDEPLYVYNDLLESNDSNQNRHKQIEMSSYIRRHKMKYTPLKEL
jgi:glycosyltransferase involved in cell wall biosynthesis